MRHLKEVLAYDAASLPFAVITSHPPSDEKLPVAFHREDAGEDDDWNSSVAKHKRGLELVAGPVCLRKPPRTQ